MEKIRCPKKEDIPAMRDFFKNVIKNTMEKEGINLDKFLEKEVESKMIFLKKYFNNKDNKNLIFIACDKEKVIGTISASPYNHKLNNIIEKNHKNQWKIGTVYVHPNYQRRGIGKNLFNTMCLFLKEKGIQEFYLDSGYKGAQKYWKQKLGEPLVIIENYWGKGTRKMVWVLKLIDNLD